VKREPVVSSNLAAIGYDPDQQLLEVEFLPSKKTGEAVVWQYRDVTPNEHAKLIRSFSLGKAFRSILAEHASTARKVAIIDPLGVERAVKAVP